MNICGLKVDVFWCESQVAVQHPNKFSSSYSKTYIFHVTKKFSLENQLKLCFIIIS